MRPTRLFMAVATLVSALCLSDTAQAGYVSVRVETRAVAVMPWAEFQQATGLDPSDGPIDYTYTLTFDPTKAIARGTDGRDFDGQYLFEGGDTRMSVSIGTFEMHTSAFRLSLWDEIGSVRVGIFGQKPWSVPTLDSTGFNATNRSFIPNHGPLDVFDFMRNLGGFTGNSIESPVGLVDWYVYGSPTRMYFVPEGTVSPQWLLLLGGLTLLLRLRRHTRRGHA